MLTNTLLVMMALYFVYRFARVLFRAIAHLHVDDGE